jgi:magnesium transporter
VTIIDNAVYIDGVRSTDPLSLEETYAAVSDCGGMAWIGLYRPDEQEIRSVADEFGLHELAVEDAVSAHQRPKMERYDNVLFSVLRPARYLDDVELVEFGELHIFTGPNFIVTVRHAESPDIGKVRSRLEASPSLLRLGPEAVLYAIVDQVVDEYSPVIAGIENDIDEIEDELFNRDTDVSRRIYQLSREVVEFQRATHPLTDMLENLIKGFDKYHVDLELQRLIRDVLDHVLRVAERAASFRAILQNALTVQATLVAQRQNEEMRHLTEASLAQNEEVKKISAWAAILFAPTLVGTIYGMNFTHMPELEWAYGYPLAIAMMIATGVILYSIFKHREWL